MVEMIYFLSFFSFQEKDVIIAPISDSPKPPPSRVTMTYPMINNCRYAVFASCGESKAEMVQVCKNIYVPLKPVLFVEFRIDIVQASGVITRGNGQS